MPKHFTKIIAVVLAASLAASLAGCADENGGKTADMVYKYNTETKELSVFYENYDDDWSDMTLTTRNVLRMTARDNKVYLLMYQGIDGSTVYSVDVYSADGEKIDEYDIGFANDEDILKEYPDLIENLILTQRTSSVEGTWTYGSSSKTGRLVVGAVGCIIDKDRTTDQYKKTCTHELGHALGWAGHSSNTSDIMYSAGSSVTSLTSRDKNHLSQVYD